jgi:predicted RNA-binding Zn ribbon-like protein
VETPPLPRPGGREPAPAPLDLVQDFANTEIPEWHRDDLDSPDRVAHWFAARGLLAPRHPVTAEEFLRARRLRTIVRELAHANTGGGLAGRDVRVTVDEVLGAVPLAAFIADDGGVGVRGAGTGVDRALGSLVAIVVASSHDGTWQRLKACDKESCRWVFFDHSRNRSSSWCSMSICGNRTKTRVYRRRRAGQETGG